MGDGRWRQTVAAVAGVGVGAAVNVVTGMLTQRWGLAWLVATVACVLIGGGLLAWLTVRSAAEPGSVDRVVASGDGAIGAGGSVVGASTKVARAPGPSSGTPGVDAGEGISASGLGAIAAGGDVRDSHTEVTGDSKAS